MSALIPRRVARPSARKPSLPASQRTRLVAAASANANAAPSTSPSAPPTASTAVEVSAPPVQAPSLSDLPSERQAALPLLLDRLFGLLSPFRLATHPRSQQNDDHDEWTHLLLQRPGSKVHVTRLLQDPSVAEVCESSRELSIALQRLASLGWIDLSPDRFSFALPPAVQADLTASSNLFRRLVQDDRIVYVEHVPRHLTSPRRVTEFVSHHLASLPGTSAERESAKVYDAYAPSRDAKPPWLSGQPTRRSYDRSIRFAQAFVVLSSPRAAEQLAELFPWHCATDGAGTRRTRCLTLKQWTAKRDEYFSWRSHLSSTTAANVTQDEDIEPSQSATPPQDPAPHPSSRAIPDEDPSIPYPIGTILYLPTLSLPHPFDPSTASRQIKAALERLVPSSVSYIDLHPPSPTSQDPTSTTTAPSNPTCHVRSSNRFVAQQLCNQMAVHPPSFVSAEDVAQARVLQDEEEREYWSTVPVKTRNAAKKRALVASQTDGTQNQPGNGAGAASVLTRAKKRKGPTKLESEEAKRKHVKFD